MIKLCVVARGLEPGESAADIILLVANAQFESEKNELGTR